MMKIDSMTVVILITSLEKEVKRMRKTNPYSPLVEAYDNLCAVWAEQSKQKVEKK